MPDDDRDLTPEERELADALDQYADEMNEWRKRLNDLSADRDTMPRDVWFAQMHNLFRLSPIGQLEARLEEFCRNAGIDVPELAIPDEGDLDPETRALLDRLGLDPDEPRLWPEDAVIVTPGADENATRGGWDADDTER